MGCKAAETTCNINNAFGPKLLMNIQCGGDSRSFAKETRVLEDEEHRGQPSEGNNNS